MRRHPFTILLGLASLVFVVFFALATALAETTAPAASPSAVDVCPVTEPITSPDPTPSAENPAWADRDPYPPDTTWYVSEDRRLWAHPWELHAGANKFFWIKPVGSELAVTGRRLDGDAPPLRADLPDGYPGDYQASGLIFPTAGCWEVEAWADGSVLRFVVAVPERDVATSPAPPPATPPPP